MLNPYIQEISHHLSKKQKNRLSQLFFKPSKYIILVKINQFIY